MTRTRFAIAALVLMILYSPLAHAAEGLPAPIVFVTNVLQLSESQTGMLISMIQMRDAALQPVAAKLHSDQEALAQLLESPAADPTTAGQLLIAIRAGEQQAGAIAHSAAASFEDILTPQQRERLQFVRQAAQVEPAIPAFKAVGLL
jgi:hypothetical protein